MTTPALPLLRATYHLSPERVGLISASFAAGMFFAVAFLPRWSDRHGRKWTASVALMCVACGFALQGCAIFQRLRFEQFLLVRFMTGLFAGCNPIFKAYLADVVPYSRLPEFMIYREASATMAFIVGPSLGGWLAASWLGPAGPFWATAVSQMLGSLLIAGLVEESVGLREPPAPDDSPRPPAGAKADMERWQWSPAALVFLMSFLYVISQSCFSSFFPLLMSDRFGSLPGDIGQTTTRTAVVALVFQVCLYRRLVRWISLKWVSFLGAAAIFLGLALLGCPGAKLWVGIGIYGFGVASFPAYIPTVLARVVPRTQRGVALGMDSIVNNICRIWAPWQLGQLYSRSPSLCFSAGGSSMLFVSLLILYLGDRNRGDKQ